MGVRLTIQYPTLYGETRNKKFIGRSVLDTGGFSFIYEVLNNQGISFAAKIAKSGDATKVSSDANSNDYPLNRSRHLFVSKCKISG